MLSRKLIINFLQNQSRGYTHKWLPNCLVYSYIPTDEQIKESDIFKLYKRKQKTIY